VPSISSIRIHYFGEKYDKSGEDGHAGHDVSRVVRGFWITVALLEFTDLIFSIDNVIAAVALSDKIWVVSAGSRHRDYLDALCGCLV
jgi:tellurite resistance protein TerC